MNDPIVALKQALPYVRLYKGKTFVVKLGGSILKKKEALDAMLEDVCLLHSVGIRVVLVHGGGPQATELSQRLGLETRMVAGRRVTDAATLEVAKMVYAGSLSVDILAAFRTHQTAAAGVSGVDANLITARKRPPRLVEGVMVDYGLVGDIEAVDPSILEQLLAGGVVPVVSSLACDASGQVLNVNADSVASALACATRAEKLVVLTDADGVLRDAADSRSLVSSLSPAGAEALKAEGRLSGGMLPKVEACLKALSSGVKRAHIINGTRPGALLVEVFTNAGCGTMISVEPIEASASELVPA